MERNDSHLVRLSRRGDREAFRELVERYHRKVLAVAMGMLHNREDALDVAQETFARAYQNLPRFKGDSAFYTWLYRIVVNLSIDFQRRERRAGRLSLDEEGEPGGEGRGVQLVAPSEGGPFARARSGELARRVREAIDELTPDHKAVILLREVEGLSYEEISQVMQCAKGTVMSRLHYARKKLQARLRELL